MMTMSELFYGVNEPTWFIDNPPRRDAGNPYNQDVVPYTAFSDDACNYRRETKSPFVQSRNVVPYVTSLPYDASTFRSEAVYPFQQSRGYVYNPTVSTDSYQTPGGYGEMMPKQNQMKQATMQNRNVAATTILMVPMCCNKCEEKVKEELLDMDDVHRVACDQWNQRVTVTGTTSAEKLLKRVRRIKKRSQLWSQSFGPAQPNHSNQQQSRPSQFQPSYSQF